HLDRPTLPTRRSSDLAIASSIGYCLPGSTRFAHACTRFATAAMSHPLHIDAHAARAARDRTHRGFEVGGREIRLLRLRDVFELLAGNSAHLARVRCAAALLDTDRFANQHGCGRGLQDEGEAAIAVHRDDHGRRQSFLDALRLRIERFAELHDVHALLTERRTDRRARIRLACRNLQLDVASDFLGHCIYSAGRSARKSSPVVLAVTFRSPNETVGCRALGGGLWPDKEAIASSASSPGPSAQWPLYAFSTCEKSNSTGVERPRICTATCRRFFS